MSDQGLILVGGGGHCRSVIDVLETAGFAIAGIVDQAGCDLRNVGAYQVLGDDDSLVWLSKTHKNALVTLGQIKTPDIRRKLFNQLKDLRFSLPSPCSPLAHISRSAALGEGTIIMHQALINAGVSIGRNCIINSRALIEHEVEIDDHCHISTGAVINGGVRIGEGTFIGSGSVCKEGLNIGSGCIIGIGSIIRHDLPPGTTFFNK